MSLTCLESGWHIRPDESLAHFFRSSGGTRVLVTARRQFRFSRRAVRNGMFLQKWTPEHSFPYRHVTEDRGEFKFMKLANPGVDSMIEPAFYEQVRSLTKPATGSATSSPPFQDFGFLSPGESWTVQPLPRQGA